MPLLGRLRNFMNGFIRYIVPAWVNFHCIIVVKRKIEFHQFMVIYKTIFTQLGIHFVPPVYTEVEPKIQHYKSDHFIYYRESHHFLHHVLQMKTHGRKVCVPKIKLCFSCTVGLFWHHKGPLNLTTNHFPYWLWMLGSSKSALKPTSSNDLDFMIAFCMINLTQTLPYNSTLACCTMYISVMPC